MAKSDKNSLYLVAIVAIVAVVAVVVMSMGNGGVVSSIETRGGKGNIVGEAGKIVNLGSADCSDSDNGISPYVKGITEGDPSWGGSSYGTFTDWCRDVPENQIQVLDEFYCNMDTNGYWYVYRQAIGCTYGCSNGACLTNPSK